MERLLERFRAFPDLLMEGAYAGIVDLTLYPAATYFNDTCIVANGPEDSIAQLSAHRAALIRAGVRRIEFVLHGHSSDDTRITVDASHVHYDHADEIVGHTRFRLYGERRENAEGFSMIEVFDVAVPEAETVLNHWHDLQRMQRPARRRIH